MDVLCEVAVCELENEDGRLQPGVQVTCSRCGHETESYGTSTRSIRRCLVLMREECPEDERNFYITEDEL